MWRIKYLSEAFKRTPKSTRTQFCGLVGFTQFTRKKSQKKTSRIRPTSGIDP